MNPYEEWIGSGLNLSLCGELNRILTRKMPEMKSTGICRQLSGVSRTAAQKGHERWEWTRSRVPHVQDRQRWVLGGAAGEPIPGWRAGAPAPRKDEMEANHSKGGEAT